MSLDCQEAVEGRWHVACGVSSYNNYKGSYIPNLKFISPRFKWSNEEWTAEMEKQPDKYKRTRFMAELFYAPSFSGMSLNVQYRLLSYGKLSLEAYGGLKFLFVTPRGYVINPYVARENKQGWYMNPGLLCQLDLGLVAPYADAGADGIVTVGAELDVQAFLKKMKRYRTPYLQGR